MATNGWGLPDAVLREWTQRQKLEATTAEKLARERAKAAAKQTNPTAGASASLWQTLWDWSPFGTKNVLTGVFDRNVAQPIGDKAKDVKSWWESLDLTSLMKWGVVGLVAVALIVVVPRLLPQR